MILKAFSMDRNFLGMVLSTIAQQAMVASSTLLLAKLTSAVVTKEGSVFLFGLFIASLVLVYLPGSFTSVFLEKWKQASFKKLLEGFARAHDGQIHLYRNEQERESRHSLFVREAWPVVESSHHYFQDVLQTSLNVIFNIVAIGAAIDGRFLPAYLVSGFIVIVALKFSGKSIGERSARCQSARVALTDVLIKGWDTIVIGNRYNRDLLAMKLEASRSDSESTAVKTKVFIELVSGGIAWLAMSPVLGLLCYIVITSQGRPEVLIALFATLHRQILTLQHMEVLVSSGLGFSFIRSQIQGVQDAMRPVPVSQLRERIKPTLVRLERDGVYADTEAFLGAQSGVVQTGRMTVRGPNGAGKSSLLQLIKSQWKEDAIYLPAHSSLIFSDRAEGLSTGQSLKISLQELVLQNSNSALLLDEWDANLDDANMRELDSLIQAISQTRLVIEVRHRYSESTEQIAAVI